MYFTVNIYSVSYTHLDVYKRQIIYTPTEGDAIAAYSHRFRKPEGVFLDITEPDSIERRLATYGGDKDVDYIVVSDSEGILGIGDQGIGGVRIAISKLCLLYTSRCV